MVVKAGYKQTEVGVIPEDWKVGPLEMFWSVTDCKHVTARFVPSGVPVASIMEVQSRFVDLRHAKQTTKSCHQLLIERGRTPVSGDLIFSRNATVGEVAQVAEWHPPFAMGQDVCLLRKRSAGFSTDFLQSVIRSPLVVTQISDLMVGSTFKRVNVEQIRKLVVPMPSPAEQEAIAESLSDADALIESLQRLIVKKRLLKQGAMQGLLTGQKRMTKFSKELNPSFKNSEIGPIPDDWELRRLEQVSAFITKGATPTTYGFKWQRTGVLFLRSECVSESGLDLAQAMYVSPEAHSVLGRAEVRSGDLLMTITGNVGRVVLLSGTFGVASINQHIARIRINDDNVSPEYVLHFLSQRQVRQHYNSITTGQAYPQISLKQVRDAVVPLPTFPEQKAIACVLSDMDAEIACLQEKLAKARQLKQGMMQELLTGRTRLV